MKRAALYMRLSTVDQNPQSQGIELREFARLHGHEIVQEYCDHGISGTKVRRPALDQLPKDPHRASLMSSWCGPATGWPDRLNISSKCSTS
jgi:DNA invertase Pin-like site-specific DNA recombinase